MTLIKRIPKLWILCSLILTCFLSSCGANPNTVAVTPSAATPSETGTALIRRQWIPDPAERCSTADPSPDVMTRVQQQLQEAERVTPRAFPITIPIAVHVIYSGLEGNLPVSVLNEQLDVINSAFAGSRFSFRIASIDRTNNDVWYNLQPGSVAAFEAKSALNISPQTTLNLYTVRKPGNLGFATFPWELAIAPSQDGVVISYDSVPGGTRENFNEGDTATHEIGHWLGLFHTFQSGCIFPGDGVSDTPFERIPSEGCPLGRNTCLFLPGQDPIFNFMDYSDDPCMNTFSDGQVQRMQTATRLYRSTLLS